MPQDLWVLEQEVECLQQQQPGQEEVLEVEPPFQ
jgi:hypothetical protein